MVIEDKTFSRVSIRQDILQLALNYLMSRPCGETWQIVAHIHADAKDVDDGDDGIPDPR